MNINRILIATLLVLAVDTVLANIPRIVIDSRIYDNIQYINDTKNNKDALCAIGIIDQFEKKIVH